MMKGCSGLLLAVLRDSTSDVGRRLQRARRRKNVECSKLDATRYASRRASHASVDPIEYLYVPPRGIPAISAILRREKSFCSSRNLTTGLSSVAGGIDDVPGAVAKTLEASRPHSNVCYVQSTRTREERTSHLRRSSMAVQSLAMGDARVGTLCYAASRSPQMQPQGITALFIAH
jgi:hypothetical protein